MKRNYFITLLILTFCMMPLCAQNKLYVISEKATLPDLVNLCDDIYPYNGGSNIFLNYTYSYPDGVYSIVDSSIPVSLIIGCSIAYDSCPPGTNCGGTLCCQEGGSRSLLDYDLELSEQIIINEGSTVSCGGFRSADPELQYYALLVPLNSQLQRNITPCSKDALFEMYNGQVNTINNISWQYYDINNEWVDIPNFQNQYPLVASVEDIFGTNYSSFFSDNLQLQYKISTSFSSTVYFSEIETFSIAPCTPEISSVPTISTSCSNISDGNFSILFERPLEDGETLSFFLHKGSPAGPVYNELEQSFIGNSYTWPDHLLEANDYYLYYQTDPNGSLKNYGPITINSPTPVTFIATWISDVDCYGDNTGSITINASGGQGNYQYSINDGLDWFSFSNATFHTVTNLLATTYRVKVKDSNGCIAQQ
ncbi:SprB repeat-containing protein [Olleya sp. Bg11-27]|uniref:SprB repeat-containing protein n=1 Tax=Olleya sp. Bg11-27 TaxID=2058135 RepID=UPI0012FD9A73|nr:SprB repeat-containing protein [Olleya sp. Bg11-27]